MTTIIITTLVIAAIGLVVGVGLVFTGDKFKVEVDQRESAVRECLPGNKTLFIHRYKAADGSVIEDFRHFFDENGTKLGWIMYDGDGELLEREVMTYVPAYNDGTAREVELKDANGNSYGTAKYDAKGNLVEDNKD